MFLGVCVHESDAYIHMSIWVCICLCMCMHVWLYVGTCVCVSAYMNVCWRACSSVWVHVCTYACGGWGTTLFVFSEMSPPFFLTQNLLTDSSNRVGQLAGEPQGFACPGLLGFGYDRTVTVSIFVNIFKCVFWRWNTGPPCTAITPTRPRGGVLTGVFHGQKFPNLDVVSFLVHS